MIAIEVVVWTFDGDVPIDMGRIMLVDRGDGTFGATATEPARDGRPPRRLVYLVTDAAKPWGLFAEAARRVHELWAS